jgi:hypothetical protein
LTVYAPGLTLDARRTADLLLQSDFSGPVGTTVLAVLIVGFTFECLLGQADGWEHKHDKRQSDVS